MQEYRFDIKRINRIFAYILLFFSLFDTARNYTVLPLWFGYIKDFSLYILLLLNITKITLPKNLGIGFYCWFLSVLFLSPLGFINAEYDGIRILIACIKYLEVFVFFLITSNSKKVFGRDLEYFIKMYIYGSLVLGLLNIVGYMFDNPFVSPSLANENMPMGNYQGRLTIGQPAIAVFPIILSFVYLLCLKKDIVSSMLANTYLLFIILSTSNTGVVSIVAVLITSFFYCVFIKHDKHLSIMLLIYILAGLILVYHFIFNSNIYDIEYLNMYTNKILAFFGENGDLQMNVRYQNWVSSISKMKGYDFLYGLGACGHYTDNKIQLVENTYVSTYVMYGCIGLLAMLSFWGKMVLHFTKNSLKDKKGLFGLATCMIFLMHMITLDIYLSYMLTFPLGFFINFAMNTERK